jgi:hypothetical protein
MQEALVRRREVLAGACEKLDVPEVEFSQAVIGAGTTLYQQVVAAGHEGRIRSANTGFTRVTS